MRVFFCYCAKISISYHSPFNIHSKHSYYSLISIHYHLNAMKFTVVSAFFLVILAGIIGCNGNVQNEKLFGFLRSAEKCTKEADPEQCVKRNLNDWCEKREDSLKDGTKIATVCECIDGNPR